jgi:hypothetical protein
MSAPECDGLCVTAADIGVGSSDQVAYPHPGCPAHSPGSVCECGQPDVCLSPTHGQISLPEALEIRHLQSRGES